MTTKEYRKLELNKIELDGDANRGNENDYYKAGIKIYATNGDTTNQLTITNKEYTQIKKILTNIKY